MTKSTDLLVASATEHRGLGRKEVPWITLIIYCTQTSTLPIQDLRT